MASPAPGRRDRSTKVAAAVLGVLLVAAAYGTLAPLRWHLHIWHRLRTPSRDAPQTSVDRVFRSLTPFLPTRGTVCLSETGLDRRATSQSHFAVQYALAPRIVILSTDCEFVIAYGPLTPPTGVDDEPFRLIHQAAEDIRLFRRLDR